ncbi:MAG: hypothetical protein SH808_03065 [Saprospiraceae bacterium]|nr:hypothetical protein [Saprospiraceae bacterium]
MKEFPERESPLYAGVTNRSICKSNGDWGDSCTEDVHRYSYGLQYNRDEKDRGNIN